MNATKWLWVVLSLKQTKLCKNSQYPWNNGRKHFRWMQFKYDSAKENECKSKWISIDFKIVLTVRLCLRFPFVPKIPLYHVNGNRPIVVHHVWPPPKFHPFLFYGTKKYDEDKYVTQLLTHGDLSLIHNSERE